MFSVRIGLVRSLVLLVLLLAWPLAGDLTGQVVDRSGGVLPASTVTILNIANGETRSVTADDRGRYRFADVAAGTYVVTAVSNGFSEAARTVVVPATSTPVSVDFTLDLGVLRSETTVTAARGERDTQMVPLRVDTITAESIRSLTPVSTGDVPPQAPGVTAVGSGPFQVRPRLRGLDSTRVLVLVNGEGLNNARTATDRAGVEVGLVDVTNRPRLSDRLQFSMGFAGGGFREDSSLLHADGTLAQADTVDDAFGFRFGAFPDPFGLTFAVDNLTDRCYREQFQFAPARGRSFTFAVTVGGTR